LDRDAEGSENRDAYMATRGLGILGVGMTPAPFLTLPVEDIVSHLFGRTTRNVLLTAKFILSTELKTVKKK